ncbi:MAG: alanine racemase [Gammaproteobacteria bacterium]|nr:alanine racemase [Gammaproteobacteria bacterium]
MSTRLTIDLGALAANWRQFERRGSIGAVVKADAYGLGLDAVLPQLSRLGCTEFFVAQAREGLLAAEVLGRSNCPGRVWVFEGVTPWNQDLFKTSSLTPVLNSELQIQRWRELGGGTCGLHVDTGMHRLGVPFVDLLSLDTRGLDLALLITHFACADKPSHPLNAEQMVRFDAVRQRYPSVPVSIGGSAAVLGPYAEQLPQNHISRPGIGLYGGNPFAEGGNPMQTVATLEARVLQVREVATGTPVGYGASQSTERPTRIATVGIGYADGVSRHLSSRGAFCFGQKRLPILGRVSMDLTQVDATDSDVQEGDWLEVFGEHLTVDEVARTAGTVSYEILTGLGQRIQRSYRF